MNRPILQASSEFQYRNTTIDQLDAQPCAKCNHLNVIPTRDRDEISKANAEAKDKFQRDQAAYEIITKDEEEIQRHHCTRKAEET